MSYFFRVLFKNIIISSYIKHNHKENIKYITHQGGTTHEIRNSRRKHSCCHLPSGSKMNVWSQKTVLCHGCHRYEDGNYQQRWFWKSICRVISAVRRCFKTSIPLSMVLAWSHLPPVFQGLSAPFLLLREMTFILQKKRFLPVKAWLCLCSSRKKQGLDSSAAKALSCRKQADMVYFILLNLMAIS